MNEDLMIQKIIELEEDVSIIKEKMIGIDNLDKKMDILMNGQDKMISILQRVDQERTFTNVRLERLEQTIKIIKQRLQLA